MKTFMIVFAILTLFSVSNCIAEASSSEPLKGDSAMTERELKEYSGGDEIPEFGYSQPTTLFTLNPGKTVNSLQKTFNKASNYTVEFQISTPAEPLNPGKGFAAAEADIHWMLNGTQITRRVSVGNGVAITGVASGVQVQLRDVTENVGAGQTANQPYEVIVSVTPGERGSIEFLPPLVQFQRAQVISAGAGLIVPIPQNVGIMAVWVEFATNNGLPGAGTFASMQRVKVTLQNPVHAVKAFMPFANEEGYVLVPPNCTELVIANGGTEDIQVQVTWGIEG